MDFGMDAGDLGILQDQVVIVRPPNPGDLLFNREQLGATNDEKGTREHFVFRHGSSLQDNRFDFIGTRILPQKIFFCRSQP
jgi:hypothetical protein